MGKETLDGKMEAACSGAGDSQAWRDKFDACVRYWRCGTVAIGSTVLSDTIYRALRHKRADSAVVSIGCDSGTKELK